MRHTNIIKNDQIGPHTEKKLKTMKIIKAILLELRN